MLNAVARHLRSETAISDVLRASAAQNGTDTKLSCSLANTHWVLLVSRVLIAAKSTSNAFIVIYCLRDLTFVKLTTASPTISFFGTAG